MRRWLFFLTVLALFVFLGCATVKKNVDYYQECMNDPECASKVQIVHDVAESTAAPFAKSNLLVEGVGYLATLLAGMLYGRKFGKKKEA